jgi:hypothetical protein
MARPVSLEYRAAVIAQLDAMRRLVEQPEIDDVEVVQRSLFQGIGELRRAVKNIDSPEAIVAAGDVAPIVKPTLTPVEEPPATPLEIDVTPTASDAVETFVCTVADVAVDMSEPFDCASIEPCVESSPTIKTLASLASRSTAKAIVVTGFSEAMDTLSSVTAPRGRSPLFYLGWDAWRNRRR